LTSGTPLFAATALFLMLTPTQARANVWNIVSNMSDEFNGSLDTGKWNVQNVQSHVNNEAQYYSSSYAFTSGGNLVLRAQKNGCGSTGWCSGEVVSNSTIAENQSFAVEWRTKLPANGDGLWPADWLVTASCPLPLAQGNCSSWPPEIDVMEQTNGSDSNGFTDWWSTFPNQKEDHSACVGVTGCGFGSAISSSFENGFHTYRVEVIYGGSIYYSVDGHEASVHPNNEPSSATMRAVMNTAVGGNGANHNPNNNGPNDQLVDYIRVYTLGGIRSGSTYVMRNKHSGMALDSGNNPVNGSQMHQWPPADNGNQKWILTSIGSGWYQVKNAGTPAECLDNTGSTSPGTIMSVWSCAALGSNQNQNWYFNNTSRGYNQISAQKSNYCLDDQSGSTSAGGAIQQYGASGKCTGGDNQNWDVSQAF
jgi:hypothetical protein